VEDMGYPFFLGSVAYQLYKMANLKGWGILDDSIMIKLVQDIAGLDK
jgi:hypothetical protein